jgi:hypothetical protein
MSSSGTMNKKQAQTSKQVKKHEDVDDFNEKIKTYITHNKGSSWELIKAPAEDMKGKANKCYMEDGCSLHLQMYT